MLIKLLVRPNDWVTGVSTCGSVGGLRLVANLLRFGKSGGIKTAPSKPVAVTTKIPSAATPPNPRQLGRNLAR